MTMTDDDVITDDPTTDVPRGTSDDETTIAERTGVTAEQLLEARDTLRLSWAKVAEHLGLGSASSARRLYAQLTGKDPSASPRAARVDAPPLTAAKTPKPPSNTAQRYAQLVGEVLSTATQMAFMVADSPPPKDGVKLPLIGVRVKVPTWEPNVMLADAVTLGQYGPGVAAAIGVCAAKRPRIARLLDSLEGQVEKADLFMLGLALKPLVNQLAANHGRAPVGEGVPSVDVLATHARQQMAAMQAQAETEAAAAAASVNGSEPE